jgi:hypothetical protein
MSLGRTDVQCFDSIIAKTNRCAAGEKGRLKNGRSVAAGVDEPRKSMPPIPTGDTSPSV